MNIKGERLANREVVMKEKCTALIRFTRTGNKPWVDKLPLPPTSFCISVPLTQSSVVSRESVGGWHSVVPIIC